MLDKVTTWIHAIQDFVCQLLPPQEEVIALNEANPTDRTVILVRDGYKPAIFDKRMSGRRHHVLHDLHDLLEYARRAGSPKISRIFCSAKGFVCSLDDVCRPGEEDATFMPQLTEQAKAWLGPRGEGIEREFDLAGFKRLVEERYQEVEGGERLLATVCRFSAKTELSFSADLSEGGKQYGFITRTAQGEGTAKLPTAIDVNLLVYQGWSEVYALHVLLDWDQDGSRVTFSLRPLRVQELFADVIDDMVVLAREELGPDWLVSRGEPKVTPFQAQRQE